jgi:hypothetical protein
MSDAQETNSSTSPPVELSSDLVDKALFLNIDLNVSTTVTKHIPKVDGKGHYGLIPTHLRGCDENPRMVLAMLRRFRQMSSQEQEKEVEYWNNLHRRQRDVFHGRIKGLQQLKLDIETQKAAWEDKAKPVTAANVAENVKRMSDMMSKKRKRDSEADHDEATLGLQGLIRIEIDSVLRQAWLAEQRLARLCWLPPGRAAVQAAERVIEIDD